MFVDAAQAARLLPGFSAPSLPFIVGQALRADLDVTRALLARNGITPVLASGDLICVGPADALGAFMLFHAAEVDDPWGARAAL